MFRNLVQARPANGRVGLVVYLAIGDFGDIVVQQVDHAPDQPRLCLPTLSQQDDVLPGEDGVFQLRDDGLLKAYNAGEDQLLCPYLGDQVFANLMADRKDLVAAGV